MIHTTTIPIVTDDRYDTEKAMTEAIVSLYRRSQAAGDEGRLFVIMKTKPETYETELGMVRTNDEQKISALMTFHAHQVREFNDDQILDLFRMA